MADGANAGLGRAHTRVALDKANAQPAAGCAHCRAHGRTEARLRVAVAARAASGAGIAAAARAKKTPLAAGRARSTAVAGREEAGRVGAVGARVHNNAGHPPHNVKELAGAAARQACAQLLYVAAAAQVREQHAAALGPPHRAHAGRKELFCGKAAAASTAAAATATTTAAAATAATAARKRARKQLGCRGARLEQQRCRGCRRPRRWRGCRQRRRRGCCYCSWHGRTRSGRHCRGRGRARGCVAPAAAQEKGAAAAPAAARVNADALNAAKNTPELANPHRQTQPLDCVQGAELRKGKFAAG